MKPKVRQEFFKDATEYVELLKQYKEICKKNYKDACDNLKKFQREYLKLQSRYLKQ